MKFGQRIEDEAKRSKRPETYFNYALLKTLIKQEKVSDVKKHLSLEMKKVDRLFRHEECECTLIFDSLKKNRWGGHVVSKSVVQHLQKRVNRLVVYGQWNYTAIEKITKKIRRYLGQFVIKESTLSLLTSWYPYTSMEPARILATLQDFPIHDIGCDSNEINQDCNSRCRRRISCTRKSEIGSGGTGSSYKEIPAEKCFHDEPLQQLFEPKKFSDSNTNTSVANSYIQPDSMGSIFSNDSVGIAEDASECGFFTRAVDQLTSSKIQRREKFEENSTFNGILGEREENPNQQEFVDSFKSDNQEQHKRMAKYVCPVCLNTQIEKAVLCSCTHMFCFSCIQQTTTCPVCRKQHLNKFAMVGSGDIVYSSSYLDSQSPCAMRHDESTVGRILRSAFCCLWNNFRMLLWYTMMVTVLLPVVLALLAIGFVWSVTVELIDAIRGKKTVYPVPLSYKRFPRIAPHGLTTAPPPWSQPSLWE